jgi:hypothetical protein
MPAKQRIKVMRHTQKPPRFPGRLSPLRFDCVEGPSTSSDPERTRTQPKTFLAMRCTSLCVAIVSGPTIPDEWDAVTDDDAGQAGAVPSMVSVDLGILQPAEVAAALDEILIAVCHPRPSGHLFKIIHLIVAASPFIAKDTAQARAEGVGK